TAEQRPDAAPELADREGLRDVVAGAELEPEHLVELVVPRGQHDDRHGALRTQPLADLEPVELRQHQVENDEVDRLGRELRERPPAGTGRTHANPVPFERVRKNLLNGVLVVDEEDGRGVRHGRWSAGDRRSRRALPTIAPPSWPPIGPQEYSGGRVRGRSSAPSAVERTAARRCSSPFPY